MKGFKSCCAEKILEIWDSHGGSENILSYSTNCPNCKQFIGLTRTSKEDALNFLKEYDLEQVFIRKNK